MPRKDGMTERSRLLRLLLLVQSHAKDEPVTFPEEAIERAGFVVRDPDAPQPDPRIEGRRILAFIAEREARRQARRRR